MAVDLDLAKLHLRLDTADEDSLVSVYLTAAQAWVENYTEKALTRGAVTQAEARFGSYITLNRGPAPTDVSIAYTDTDGEEQTISDASIVGPRVYYLGGWPSHENGTEIIVSYTAGFSETPGDLDAAVLLLVGDFYANREAGTATPAVTMAVEALCRPYRSVRV